MRCQKPDIAWYGSAQIRSLHSGPTAHTLEVEFQNQNRGTHGGSEHGESMLLRGTLSQALSSYGGRLMRYP